MNDKLRCDLLGIHGDYGCGGCERFYGVDLRTFEELVDRGFIDLDGRQNDSPSAGAFLKLIQKYPDEPLTIHGYAISPGRDDCRVTIEGMEGASQNREFIADFMNMCRYADQFYCVDGDQHCWYD